MAVTNTINVRTVMGDQRVIMGSTVNTGTGGEVATGLTTVNSFLAVPQEGVAAEIAVNETFPLPKGEVTVVAENGVNFAWTAIGK